MLKIGDKIVLLKEAYSGWRGGNAMPGKIGTIVSFTSGRLRLDIPNPNGHQCNFSIALEGKWFEAIKNKQLLFGFVE